MFMDIRLGGSGVFPSMKIVIVIFRLVLVSSLPRPNSTSHFILFLGRVRYGSARIIDKGKTAMAMSYLRSVTR
jgi:hypothetical protein